MELASEEIHPQVAKLTGLRRRRDSDHLARTALQDDQITHPDEMAGDGDGVGGEASTRLDIADAFTNAFADAGGAGFVARHDHFLLAIVVGVMVVMEGVEDAISGTFDPAPETVVVSVIVVVAHVVSWGLIGGADFFFGDFDLLVRGLTAVLEFVGGVGTATIFALGDVELRFVGSVSSVTALNFDVDYVIFCWTGVAEEIVSEEAS